MAPLGTLEVPGAGSTAVDFFTADTFDCGGAIAQPEASAAKTMAAKKREIGTTSPAPFNNPEC
jgi:hypothetical protein